VPLVAKSSRATFPKLRLSCWPPPVSRNARLPLVCPVDHLPTVRLASRPPPTDLPVSPSSTIHPLESPHPVQLSSAIVQLTSILSTFRLLQGLGLRYRHTRSFEIQSRFRGNFQWPPECCAAAFYFAKSFLLSTGLAVKSTIVALYRLNRITRSFLFLGSLCSQVLKHEARRFPAPMGTSTT
jgi:hypothetical protein